MDYNRIVINQKANLKKTRWICNSVTSLTEENKRQKNIFANTSKLVR